MFKKHFARIISIIHINNTKWYQTYMMQHFLQTHSVFVFFFSFFVFFFFHSHDPESVASLLNDQYFNVFKSFSGNSLWSPFNSRCRLILYSFICWGWFSTFMLRWICVPFNKWSFFFLHTQPSHFKTERYRIIFCQFLSTD